MASSHDHAVAYLDKNPTGQMSVSWIDLRPFVRFDTGFAIEPATQAEMQAEMQAETQDRAHRYCFVANSLADSVVVTIV